MEFQHSVIDLIKTRISSRTFKALDIEENTLEKLKAYIAELNGEAKIKARFVLVTAMTPCSFKAKSWVPTVL